MENPGLHEPSRNHLALDESSGLGGPFVEPLEKPPWAGKPLDESLEPREPLRGPTWLGGPICPVGTGLVVFDANKTTAIPLCGNDGARQKRVYTSEGPVLRLFVQTFSDVASQSPSRNSVSALKTGTLGSNSFLIKYQGNLLASVLQTAFTLSLTRLSHPYTE